MCLLTEGLGSIRSGIKRPPSLKLTVHLEPNIIENTSEVSANNLTVLLRPLSGWAFRQTRYH